MKKILSIFLTLCIIVNMLPVITMAEEIHTTVGGSIEIISFAPLIESEKSVSLGTSIEDLELPETLDAMVRTTLTTTSSAIEVEDSDADELEEVNAPQFEETTWIIPVTWNSRPEYDMDTEGDYVFTPVIEGCNVSAEFPEITVTVDKFMVNKMVLSPMAGDKVAKNTNKSLEYNTLQDAVDAVSDDDIIELLENITLTNSITIKKDNNKNFTLDLKGKILDSGSNTAIDHNGTGTLTITDTGSGGKVTSSANIAPTTTINLNDGNLVVEGGTIENTWDGENANAILKDHDKYGTIKVIGGTIIATSGTSIYYGNLPYPYDPTVPRGILIPSGRPIIQGGLRAINREPNVTDYDNVKVWASINYDGSSPEVYNAALIYKYKYLKFGSDASDTTVGIGGNYELSETGLRAAISAASDGDTIRFISGGTVKLSQNIDINKSITLDLNNQEIDFNGFESIGSFKGVRIPKDTSVSIQGPGSISTDNYISVSQSANLIVQGGAVIEGTGYWQTLINHGTLFMTDGALQHSKGKFVLENSGTATFNRVTLQSGCEREPVASTYGPLILNDCKLINTFSGTGSWEHASILTAYNSATVTLNGGILTAPEGSTAPGVYIGIDATFTNSGATITNGYVKNLKNLTVDLSSGSNKVRLKGQTPEIGVTYYYKMTAMDSRDDKPTLDGSAAFVPAGWTAFSGDTDILTTSATTVYVQVVKVGDSEQKIYGWGQDSANPDVTSYTITATAGTGGSISPSGNVTVNNGASQSFTITADSNYSVADVKVDGISQGKITSYTFPNVTSNQVISASFTYNGCGSSGGGSSTGGGSGSSPSSGNDSGQGGSSIDDNSISIIVILPTIDKPNAPIQGVMKLTGTVDKEGKLVFDLTDKNVNDAFEKALADAKAKGYEQNAINLVLNISTGNKTVSDFRVNLPKKVQDMIINKKILNTIVVVDNPDISIGMDLDTIREINRKVNADVNITARPGDKNKLSADGKKVIGSRPVFDLQVNYGNSKEVESFGKGRVIVTIPYTLGANEKAENVKAVYVDKSGKVNWITNSSYDSVDKVLRFSTDHFSTYAIGYMEDRVEFKDITGHWAKEDIDYVVGLGLLEGTSTTTFSPNAHMTRGMFVTVLGRLANIDDSNYKNSSYTDVERDAYYMVFIEWAREKGIVKGIGNGKFGPDQSITREQIAVIMSNYAKIIGYTLPELHEENIFSDSEKISRYAKDAVKKMQRAAVFSGKEFNLFDPQGAATRAEASSVLRRLVEMSSEINKK